MDFIIIQLKCVSESFHLDPVLENICLCLKAMGSHGQALVGLLLLLLLLLVITCSSHSSLVKVNNGVKVKRGQSVYLQEGDLQFHIPRQKDACKVEVVLNEPITQRVGKVLPQVREEPFYNVPGFLPCLLLYSKIFSRKQRTSGLSYNIAVLIKNRGSKTRIHFLIEGPGTFTVQFAPARGP